MWYLFTELLHSTFDLFTRVGVDNKLIQYYMDSSDGARNNPSYFNNYLHIDKETTEASPDDDQFDIFKISISNGGPVPDANVRKGVSNILEEVFGP